VDPWRRRAGERAGTVLRIERQDRRDSEDGGAVSLSGTRRLALDGLHHRRNSGPIELRRQMGPARNRREGDGFDRGVSQASEILAPKTGDLPWSRASTQWTPGLRQWVKRLTSRASFDFGGETVFLGLISAREVGRDPQIWRRSECIRGAAACCR
jgi:hypothetical protein